MFPFDDVIIQCSIVRWKNNHIQWQGLLESRSYMSLLGLFLITKSNCNILWMPFIFVSSPLQWRQNGHDSVLNHQPRDCLLNRLFRRRSKKTSKLRVTGLCAGYSPVPGEFPAQMASNAENASISWLHHASWPSCGDTGVWWRYFSIRRKYFYQSEKLRK